MALRWNKAALSELSLLRGEGRPPRLEYDAKALVQNVEIAFASHAQSVASGLPHAPEEDRALTERIIALANGLTPDTPLVAEEQGALAALVLQFNRHPDLERELLRHWMVRGGLPFAVEALFERATHALEHLKVDGRIQYSVAWLARRDSHILPLQDEPREELVRAIVCASEPEYSAVVSRVGALRARAPQAGLRCDLDALVLTERVWASEDVGVLLAAEQIEGWQWLPAFRLFRALDAESVEALLVRGGDNLRRLSSGIFDVVRTLEERALPFLVRTLASLEADPPTANNGLAEARRVARALALFEDPRAAAAFTPWIGDTKSLGPAALEYMQTYPALAVSALAPSMLEKTRRAEAAQALLTRIVRTDPAGVTTGMERLPAAQRSAVQRLLDAIAQGESAEEAPPEALPAVLRDPPWRSAKVREALGVDPLAECPRSPPKLSAFADVEGLPPLLLADGRRIANDAKRNLLEMLQFTPLEPPYAGVGQVRDALDTASVDRLLLALVEAWVAAGGTTASAWALRAVAHLGSDAVVRDLVSSIRRWLREKGRPRALLGVQVLRRMGTDVALMHLYDLSKTARNRVLEQAATDALTAASEARGLTRDQLEDRLTPALGLDASGSATLDFGPRQLVVRVDEHLQPVLFDGGTRIPSFPRANKQDDAEKAKAASTRYKALKADLETVGKTLLARLERAMVVGRRWAPGEYRALLVDHPLAGRVARRLVWGLFEGPGRGALAGSFRVAEDATLAGVDDAMFALPEGVSVGIPHALELSEELRARWGMVLADYELVQPFEQVGRATFALAEGEVGATSFTRFGGREVPSGPFLGRMETRGWRRGPVDDGWIGTFEKDFGGVTAVAQFTPALDIRGKPPEACKLESVTFGGVKLGDLPPVVFSEAAYDLAPLAPR